MRKRRFAVDIDNVLGRTDEVMRQVIKQYTGGHVDLARKHILEFDYVLCRDARGHSITREQWTQIHRLFSTPRYLWLIEPYEGVRQALTSIGQKYEVHLVTSRLPEAWCPTIEWLRAHEIPLDALHFVGRGQKHLCVGAMDLAVEDDYDQALAFVRMGKPCFLPHHPWNHGKPRVDLMRWVGSWRELSEILLSRG